MMIAPSGLLVDGLFDHGLVHHKPALVGIGAWEPGPPCPHEEVRDDRHPYEKRHAEDEALVELPCLTIAHMFSITHNISPYGQIGLAAMTATVANNTKLAMNNRWNWFASSAVR
jgi:hypothetical protein